MRSESRVEGQAIAFPHIREGLTWHFARFMDFSSALLGVVALELLVQWNHYHTARTFKKFKIDNQSIEPI
jgi:hypothetical protein